MYQKSEQHKENYKKAAALGLLAQNALLTQRKDAYYKNPKPCLTCSNPIPYEKKKENKFCQKSCSASFNNKTRGPHSQETKRKISSTTKKSIALLMERDLRAKAEIIQKICTACDNTFAVKKSKKNQVFCSSRCRIHFHKTDEETLKKAVAKGQISVQQQMQEGKWKGWSGQGENVRSYPEKFVEDQLVKAGAPYSFQKQMGRFKIDFAFDDKKIALEVDGKQHEYPKQKESDQRKDAYLAHIGWRVFRIKWKSIKTEQGRQKMQDQINLLLDAVLL